MFNQLIGNALVLTSNSLNCFLSYGDISHGYYNSSHENVIRHTDDSIKFRIVSLVTYCGVGIILPL